LVVVAIRSLLHHIPIRDGGIGEIALDLFLQPVVSIDNVTRMSKEVKAGLISEGLNGIIVGGAERTGKVPTVVLRPPRPITPMSTTRGHRESSGIFRQSGSPECEWGGEVRRL